MSRNVPLPPHPSSVAAEMITGSLRFAREWYDWFITFAKAVVFNTPLTGTATFASSTTVSVTFTTPELTANYLVIVERDSTSRSYAVGSKTTTGFTITSTASTSATVNWILHRL